MVLTLPGRVLALGRTSQTRTPPSWPSPATRSQRSSWPGSSRFRLPATTAARSDWSNLHQRMHYIVHLFRVFHLSKQLSEPPFNAGQVATFSRGVIPEGEL